MMRLLGLMLVACSKPAPPPACGDVGRHAVEHIEAPHPMKADLPKLKLLQPWSPKLTDDDRRYLERQCEKWPEDYRRCVMTTRGDRVDCSSPGPSDHDAEWIMLPHVRDWFARVQDDANGVSLAAARHAVEVSETVGRLVAAVEAARTKPERDKLAAELEAAQKALARAHELAISCRVNPLEQADCVAVFQAHPP